MTFVLLGWSDGNVMWFLFSLTNLINLFVSYGRNMVVPWILTLIFKLKLISGLPIFTLVYNFTKSNTPPWVFFTFFQLYKWYQIAQSVSYTHLFNVQILFILSSFGGYTRTFLLKILLARRNF